MLQTQQFLNSNKKNSRLFILLFLFSALMYSCKDDNAEQLGYYKITGNTQGTTYSIIYQGDEKTVLKSEIDSVLLDFDMSLSTYKFNSIISRINYNDTNVVIDKYFKRMFDAAYKINQKTNGAFDITVGTVVKAWGFGVTESNDTITEQLIDSLLQYVGMPKVRIEGDKLIKDYPEILLDGNAIAQGLSVDVISEFIETKGINDYLVEIGGELKAKGQKYDRDWIVGIDKPIDNIESGKELQVKLELKDKSLATSGNYRKFYIKDGKKYSHSINPKTGYPAYQDILSATIITDDCMTADAYATACMVSGLEKSKQFIKANRKLDAYLIYSGNNGELKVYYTKGVETMIVE